MSRVRESHPLPLPARDVAGEESLGLREAADEPFDRMGELASKLVEATERLDGIAETVRVAAEHLETAARLHRRSARDTEHANRRTNRIGLAAALIGLLSVIADVVAKATGLT